MSEDLMLLVASGVIPSECRSFYEDLPASRIARDVVPEESGESGSEAEWPKSTILANALLFCWIVLVILLSFRLLLKIVWDLFCLVSKS